MAYIQGGFFLNQKERPPGLANYIYRGRKIMSLVLHRTVIKNHSEAICIYVELCEENIFHHTLNNAANARDMVCSLRRLLLY